MYLSDVFFNLCGWKFVNNLPPNEKKFVVIGCPHTSNWDFLLAMVFFYRTKIKGRFTIKKQWLNSPFGLILKKLGAIGIDRELIAQSGKSHLTDYLASLIKETKDDFAILITPEGTRKNCSIWKTGFYHIALKAKVPIALAYGDYKKKELGIGMVIYPRNFERDMQIIMNFYSKIHPKNPKLFSLDSRFEKIDWESRPLVYSCSGCSNVAQLANSIALRLRDEGYAQMSCIAGVGAGVKPLVLEAQKGRPIIAIDGCSLKCSYHCLKNLNIEGGKYIEISKEFSLKKDSFSQYEDSLLNKTYLQIIKKYF